MKVLVTGSAGQVGAALLASAPDGVHAVGCDRSRLDLADTAAIRRIVEAERPAVVINCAAYTAVDKAESERELAFAINANAPAALAHACRQVGARLVHVSTDYVFDGRGPRPYRPDDPTAPLSVYGESKLAGERAVAAEGGLDWRVVRTAWVYSAGGKNFLNTMLRLLAERDEVRVVADQVGTPTSAPTLSSFLWAVARTDGEPGVLHYTDAGVASWYDFAVAIHEEARAAGRISNHPRIVPIATEDYPTPARRPAYSVLDARSSLARVGATRPHWRVALRDVLRESQT
jgi:dTDP-4-dehydrorhamnose reductase